MIYFTCDEKAPFSFFIFPFSFFRRVGFPFAAVRDGAFGAAFDAFAALDAFAVAHFFHVHFTGLGASAAAGAFV